MKEVTGEQGKPRRPALASLRALAPLLLVSGCQDGPRTEPEPSGTSGSHDAQPAGSSGAIAELAPLRRAELLAAVNAAASEVAAGNTLPKSNLGLSNRTFDLRLPIGCSDGLTGTWGEWRFDPASRVLRVNVRRQNWTDDPAFRDLAPQGSFDAIEGFWIERPWTTSEKCPPAVGAPLAGESAPAKDPKAETPSQQTLALAQYFSPEAPRTLRRGSRPYAHTSKLPESAQGRTLDLRIKLVGRITGFSDGQPIHCRVAATMQRPVCAVAVQFSEVVLEDAETGERLAEWTS